MEEATLFLLGADREPLSSKGGSMTAMNRGKKVAINNLLPMTQEQQQLAFTEHSQRSQR